MANSPNFDTKQSSIYKLFAAVAIIALSFVDNAQLKALGEVGKIDDPKGLSIGSAFVTYEEDGSTYVWAENRNKLEKRPVTLGEYDMMTDTYEIMEGLTEDDYIAFPDYELCKVGAPTTHSEVVMEEEIFEGAVMEGGVA